MQGPALVGLSFRAHSPREALRRLSPFPEVLTPPFLLYGRSALWEHRGAKLLLFFPPPPFSPPYDGWPNRKVSSAGFPLLTDGTRKALVPPSLPPRWCRSFYQGEWHLFFSFLSVSSRICPSLRSWVFAGSGPGRYISFCAGSLFSGLHRFFGPDRASPLPSPLWEQRSASSSRR